MTKKKKKKNNQWLWYNNGIISCDRLQFNIPDLINWAWRRALNLALPYQ